MSDFLSEILECFHNGEPEKGREKIKILNKNRPGNKHFNPDLYDHLNSKSNEELAVEFISGIFSGFLK